MKRFLLFVCLSLTVTCVAALAYDKIEPPKSCQQCGMDRSMFAYSRIVIVYSDGESFGTCSLHCAAAALKKNSGRKVKSLQVADFKSRKLIDAKSAVWVIGGKKNGVMTALPKWAFARKGDADLFVKEHGGRIAGFGEAMALAEKE